MRLEDFWEWLDAVDQDHLEPLHQWGVLPSRHMVKETSPMTDTLSRGSNGEVREQNKGKCDADKACLLKSTQPSGILLRNGSIRMTGSTSSPSTNDAEKKSHANQLIPRSPKNLLSEVETEKRPLPVSLGINIPARATAPKLVPSPTRQPHSSGRQGPNFAIKRKKVPTNSPERARTRAVSGIVQPVPVIRVEATDPVAVNCQGARVVVEGYGKGSLWGKIGTSRRHTTAVVEGGALHRSNALKRPSNVRVGSRFRWEK